MTYKVFILLLWSANRNCINSFFKHTDDQIRSKISKKKSMTAMTIIAASAAMPIFVSRFIVKPQLV
jgi:hypothetical protein